MPPGNPLCSGQNHGTAGYQRAAEYTSTDGSLANQLRSLLAENGLILPVGNQRIQRQQFEIIEDTSNDLTFTLRRLLSSLREDMQALSERVTCLDKDIAALSSQQTSYRHLLTIPGVGPLTAAAFISEVDAVQFSNGRELSAWCTHR